MLLAPAPGRNRNLTLCVVLLAFSFLFLSACGRGNGSSSDPQTTSAPTVTISASATKIAAGGSLTLTVVASNAAQVVISDNCDSNTYTLQATGGTQVVPVPSTPGTCTYTATASGSGTAVATVPITVAPSTATVVSVSANSQTITAGQSVSLTVTVANTSSVYITNNLNNTSIPVSSAGGTVTVAPSQTTIYTVTGTGANNQQSTAQVTITVMGVTIAAAPSTIVTGSSSTLTVTATNAAQVVISDNVDTNTYTLAGTGGTQAVSPTVTTTYTATATYTGGATATATVTVNVNATASTALINHVIFLMQENRTFDTYFGMLNPYRQTNGLNIGDDGKEYDVDGLAGTNGVITSYSNTNDPPASTTFPMFKFATACVDDMSSAWLESYGAVNTYDFFFNRPILMDGFVHDAEDYAKTCAAANGKTCSGNPTDDLVGQRAMGYYNESFLNYYYYMASQFALSDRWFSPVSSKSTPNRIATMTGGTTQGLVYDPFKDDKFTSQLAIPTIFGKLTKAGVSWRIYYGITEGGCTENDGDCGNSTMAYFPSITFADFTDSYQYMYAPATPGVCSATTTPSGQAVGDPKNAFCIDTNHIAPVSQYFTDVANGTLPQYAFIEPAYGIDDEHPGSGQSILSGQTQVAKMLNALMNSVSWKDSVFFLAYDEGGGPFDHVPPVPGSTNKNTNSALGITTDISSIAVNPDAYSPCPANGPPLAGSTQPTPTLHCDLEPHVGYDDPGYNPTDAAAEKGFAAQLGFRLPNMVVSPFTRKHYVSHIPMDHTAIIRFVEDRFINNQQYLTNRDAAQPNLLDFFDFVNVPWSTPPTQSTTPPPTPLAPSTATCTPATMQ